MGLHDRLPSWIAHSTDTHLPKNTTKIPSHICGNRDKILAKELTRPSVWSGNWWPLQVRLTESYQWMASLWLKWAGGNPEVVCDKRRRKEYFSVRHRIEKILKLKVNSTISSSWDQSRKQKLNTFCCTLHCRHPQINPSIASFLIIAELVWQYLTRLFRGFPQSQWAINCSFLSATNTN